MKQVDKYQFIKTYDELTDIEKAKLILPVGSTPEDYADYHVQYNKKGELVHVKKHAFSEKKSAEIRARANQATLLDYCIATAPKGTVSRKSKRIAQKRIQRTLGE